jgi:hypothetical protein
MTISVTNVYPTMYLKRKPRQVIALKNPSQKSRVWLGPGKGLERVPEKCPGIYARAFLPGHFFPYRSGQGVREKRERALEKKRLEL